MRVLYRASPKDRPIPIPSGLGSQFVLLWLKKDSNQYVYYCDTYLAQTYINRVIDKSLLNPEELFHGDNFARIESDEEFDEINKWIEANYNFNGIHDDKLDIVQGDAAVTEFEKLMKAKINGK